MDTLESIAKHRSDKGKEAAIKLEEKRSASQREVRDPKVQALQERLSARRAGSLVKNYLFCIKQVQFLASHEYFLKRLNK